MATVKIPPVLRAQTDGAAEVGAGGATVGEVLSGLAEAHPGTRTQLFSAEGDLNRYVNVYLNDEDVRVLDGLGHAGVGSRHGRDPAGDGRRGAQDLPVKRTATEMTAGSAVSPTAAGAISAGLPAQAPALAKHAPRSRTGDHQQGGEDQEASRRRSACRRQPPARCGSWARASRLRSCSPCRRGMD